MMKMGPLLERIGEMLLQPFILINQTTHIVNKN